MMQVSYTGLYNSSLQLIQEQLQATEELQFTATEDALEKLLLHSEKPVDVLLIGEQINNPIKLAQWAYSLDKHLSIVIINDPKNHQQIKQALLFAPFMGNTLQCLPNNLGPGLAATIQDAITRTRQRRSYARLQQASLSFQPNTHLYEKVKTHYLDKFLEEAPIGALLLNREGLVMAINRHATKILQTTEKEILGKGLDRLFPEDSRKALEQFIKNDFSVRSTRNFQRRLQKKLQHLELRIAEIPQDGAPYKIGILADITNKVLNRQKIEQQLEALAQTNSRLQRANADLDTFVYTASHDLKAPIANIEGLIELLKRKIEPENQELEPIFQMIQRSIHRFQATIRDLTEVTHMERKGEDDSLLDVEEVVQEVQLLVQEMILSTGAHIETDFKNCPRIRFSRSGLRSIVYNLLSNALKYRSQERKACIRIQTAKTGPYALLSVKDNGLGFSEDKKDKIFTMFRRLHSHVEGTGIGLFIVKRLVDNAQGYIEVESTPNEGSIFKIYLKQKAPKK